MPKRILLVDNYDSFTHNIRHLFENVGDVVITVLRNDDPSLRARIRRADFSGVVIGPGPGSPEDQTYFGYNKEIILKDAGFQLPLLGICLGFQGIYHLFGGKLKLGFQPVHGKTSPLFITDESPILRNVPNYTPVMRYHSIVADTLAGIPDCLKITACTARSDGQGVNLDEPMALEHRTRSIYGVQFHPESFATPSGSIIARNFVSLCRSF